MNGIQTHFSGDRGTDCAGNCKPNYPTITTMTSDSKIYLNINLMKWIFAGLISYLGVIVTELRL